MKYDDQNLDRQLLEQTTGLRCLALRLVRDEALAEDLVQDTWLAFLRKPPSERRAVRSWASRVLRNLGYRSYQERERRRRRETAAARSEVVLTDPHQLLERAETLRRLVEAVIELEEPLRSTVLLRFFEDLEPKTIASQQGIHVNTVRLRLREATHRLRRRLDREHGGDRGTWCRALLPLIGVELLAGNAAAAAGAPALGSVSAAASQSTAVLLSLGGTVMGSKTIGALAVCIVGIISLTIGIGFGRITANVDERRATAPPVVHESSETGADALAGDGSDDGSADAEAPLAQNFRDRALAVLGSIPLTTVPTGDGSIRGMVTTREGEPLPGVSVYGTFQEAIGFPPADIENPDETEVLVSQVVELVRSRHRLSQGKQTVTDENGEFILEGISDDASYSVKVYREGWKMMDADLQKLGSWPDNWAVHTRYGSIKRDVRSGQSVHFVAEAAVRLELDVRFVDGRQPESAKVFHRRSDWRNWRHLYWYPNSPTLLMAEGSYQVGVRIGEDHAFRSDNVRFHLTSSDPEPKVAVIVYERTGLSGTVSVPPGEDQERLWLYLDKLPDAGEPNLDRLVSAGKSATAKRGAGYQFRFKELAPGPHVLGVGRIRGEIQEAAVIEIEVGAVARETVELSPLEPHEYLEVVAVGPSGDPVDIVKASVGGQGAESRAIVRRSTGVVWVVYPRRLIAEPSGHPQFTLSVTAGGYGSRQEQVPAGAVRHVIRFAPPIHLGVTVDGYAASEFSDRMRFRVYAGESSNRSEVARVPSVQPRPSADGTQDFVASQPGPYQFYVDFRDADRGWRSIASTRLELVAGDNALRVVLPNLVSIRAVASLELVGRTVHLRPSGEREDGWQPSTRWARVNEDGQVKFAAVPAGEYRIVPSWSSNAVDVVTSLHSVVELPTVIKETSGTARDEPGSRTTGRSGSGK